MNEIPQIALSAFINNSALNTQPVRSIEILTDHSEPSTLFLTEPFGFSVCIPAPVSKRCCYV